MSDILYNEREWGVYLCVPSARLSDVSRRLLFIVRIQKGCDLGVAEQVSQPRPDRQVVDDLGCASLAISPGKPPISAADRAA